MRRALLVVLALPASALAQSAGTISLPAGFQRINIAQCTGTQNAIIGNDSLTAALTWTLNPGTNTFLAGQGTVSLYAANEQPAAGQGTGVSCTAPNTSTTTFRSTKVANTDGLMDITPTGLTMTQTFAWKDIVSASTLTCTSTTTATVYLCVQWNSGSVATAGFAIAQVTLDPTAPAAPSNVSWSPGDGTIHLTASVDSTTTSCKAVATSTADSSTHASGQDACDSLSIDGLTNQQGYSVVVYGINVANNPSAASTPITATPYPTDDFWTRYKNANGRDSGGCSTGAGAAGLLSALGLLAIRRRKP